jgi:hypothetical protein
VRAGIGDRLALASGLREVDAYDEYLRPSQAAAAIRSQTTVTTPRDGCRDAGVDLAFLTVLVFCIICVHQCASVASSPSSCRRSRQPPGEVADNDTYGAWPEAPILLRTRLANSPDGFLK